MKRQRVVVVLTRPIILVTLLTLILAPIVSPIHISGSLQKEISQKLLFPKSMFPQSDAYKTGWAAGFLGQLQRASY